MALRGKMVKQDRLTKLARDYGKRFKTKVPNRAYRALSLGESSRSELQGRISRALLAGRPDPEWEAELQRAQATPAEARSLQQEIEVRGLELAEPAAE